MSFNPRTHSGCDIGTVILSRQAGGFNPRTHSGCDMIDLLPAIDELVSIHAPTRGATACDQLVFDNAMFQSTHPLGVRQSSTSLISMTFGFNPRTHSGCDSAVDDLINSASVFQSTHPLGVRLCATSSSSSLGKFQSTHPLGVRPCAASRPPRHPCVSIHAPTRGATTLNFLLSYSKPVSIHAPTRGATCPCSRHHERQNVSIHAPTRGATNREILTYSG